MCGDFEILRFFPCVWWPVCWDFENVWFFPVCVGTLKFYGFSLCVGTLSFYGFSPVCGGPVCGGTLRFYSFSPVCGDFEILRFFPVFGAPVRREAKTFQISWKAEHTLKTNQGFILEDFYIENVPYIFCQH